MQKPAQESSETFAQLLKSVARSASFWSFAAGVVGTIAVVGGGIIYLSVDEIQGYALVVLIIGAALLLLALALSPRAVGMFLVGRQGRYGANVLLMTVAFFAIAILINFLFFRDSNRFDVTATRFFSLAPQTVNILTNLDTKIRANAFYLPGDAGRLQAEDLLNEFSRQTNKFTFRFEDPELNRALASKYGVTSYPAIVIEDESTGILQSVVSPSEQQVATGILVVTGIKQKKVYNLTGHSERSLTRDAITFEIDSEGFDLALEGLLRDNYAVQALNLQQVLEVPEDAVVVVIAGPEQDLEPEELEALTRYAQRGGRIIALLDPNTPASFNSFLGQWGVSLGNHTIADAASSVAGKILTPLVQRANGQYVSDQASGISITDQVDVTFYPDATSVETSIAVEELPPQIVYVALALTTPASWLETNVDNPAPDPEVDRPGPFSVASVVQACDTLDAEPVACGGKPITKIVVFGDSDFVKNQFFSSRDNADIFLNSVNYLADDFDLISIRPKFFPVRELVVTKRERDFIQWSSWFLPPAVMAVLGVWVWWRRR